MFEDLDPAATHRVKSAMRLLRPYDMVGQTKLRVGRFFDGGYVMLDRLDGVGAAYSLGINDDVSWDIDIAARGVPIFQYDPTIKALPAEHKLFNWSPIWIETGPDDATNVETLESLIEQNGHQDRTDLVLKCDIEGAEWPLLQRTPNKVLRQFSQMVFEIHNLGFLADQHHGDNVRQAFLNLTASHHVVHVHGNNFAGWCVVGGVPLPGVIEVTLVRKDEGSFVPSSETFPTSLDMPCNASLADLHLGSFVF